MPRDWLDHKSIVIIGGTTGIGWAAANSFVDQGARVVVVGHDEASVQGASAKLNGKGIALRGEATEAGVATDAIETCMQTYGSFDGLYHVAGGSGRQFGDGPLHELSIEGWNKTFTLNLTSLMLSNQAAVKMFLKLKVSGSILNIGSVLGFSPSPKYFVTHAYAASKAAVEGFSRSIAAYYSTSGIRINVLAPGLVETPMSQRAARDQNIVQFIATKQPLEGGRIGQPDDLVGAALYFMSDHSKFTTGQVLYVDGGWSISEGQYAAL